MTQAEWFAGVVVTFQWGAAIFYALQRRWPDAMIWLCAGGANAALVWKVLREGAAA
jgi:hypothetical protein